MELSAERIRAQLGMPELPVYVYETLTSTSDECRRLLAAGERQCLVLAPRQTGGRGRSGKTFYAPEGGLYLSLAMPMPEDAALLTCRAAVVTAETVEDVSGISCGIKWVNDLYLHGRKVCGILTEAVPGSVIVGIGVNLSPAPVPEALEGVMGFLDCGDLREALSVGIVRRMLRQEDDGRMMEAYRQRSVVLGRELVCTAGTRRFSARALEIDDAGGLVVQGPAGRETLRFGEVSVRGDFSEYR